MMVDGVLRYRDHRQDMMRKAHCSPKPSWGSCVCKSTCIGTCKNHQRRSLCDIVVDVLYGGGLYDVGGEELGKVEVWLARVNRPRGTEMRDTRSYMRQVTNQARR